MFLIILQAEFSTMFHAKFVEITVRANIMEFMLVMDVLDFLNAQFDEIDNMFVNQNVMVYVKLIKHIEINAALVDSKSASKLA